MDASLFYMIIRDTRFVDLSPWMEGPYSTLDEAKDAARNLAVESKPSWQTIIFLVRPTGVVEQTVVGKYVLSNATEFKWV